MTVLLRGFVPDFDTLPIVASVANIYERKTKIDVLGRSRTWPSIADRLWRRIDMSAGLDGCWPWGAGTTTQGYGEITTADGATDYVHRLVYRALVGPIPSGLELDHLCHSRSRGCPAGPRCLHRRCANPTHLEPVTCAENIRRASALIERCKSGHEYTPENTAYDGHGYRRCRECHRLERRQAYVPKPRRATLEVRAEIIALQATGLSGAAIGRRVGLSQSYVSRLIQRSAQESLVFSNPDERAAA